MHIDFVYDVVCPYAYLASTRVEAAAARHGATVRWRPILLGGLFREIGAPDDPNATMPEAKATLVRRDIERWADLLGVPLSRPAEHPRRTVDAMRLCTLADPDKRPAVSRALFSAYWIEGRDVSDPEVLAAIATEHGLSPAAIREPATKAALRDATAEAAAQGAFGVPTFRIGDRLWWGQDRLDLALCTLGTDGVDAGVDRSPRALPRQTAGTRSITFVHDFSSPFSYLASTAIEAVAARHGVPVTWHPILLGALFRSIGTPDVPLFTMTQRKQQWVARDLEDWAKARGVPFRFPSHFPMRSILPLRVALAEPKTAPAIYRAAWGDDRRVDEPQALASVLADAGFSPEPLIEATNDPEIKERLKSNTMQAKTLGVCGVPTVIVVDDRHEAPLLLWGQDRLGMLDAVLSGWWPSA